MTCLNANGSVCHEPCSAHTFIISGITRRQQVCRWSRPTTLESGDCVLCSHEMHQFNVLIWRLSLPPSLYFISETTGRISTKLWLSGELNYEAWHTCQLYSQFIQISNLTVCIYIYIGLHFSKTVQSRRQHVYNKLQFSIWCITAFLSLWYRRSPIRNCLIC